VHALPSTPRSKQCVERLLERLERADARSSSPTQAHVLSEDRAHALPSEASTSEERDERQHRYPLWTFQQVASAFGRPDVVYEGDGH
jgi:hypothetical protein